MRILKKLCSEGAVSLEDIKPAHHSRVKKSAEEIECAINSQMKLTSRALLSKMINRLESCDNSFSAPCRKI